MNGLSTHIFLPFSIDLSKYLYMRILKSSFLIVVLLGFSQVLLGQKAATLQGKIKRGKDDKAFVVWQVNPIAPQAQLSAPIDKDGNFSLDIPLSQPQTVIFGTSQEQTELFLFPGETLTLNVDVKEFDESLTYEGGKSAAASRFMIKWFLAHRDMGSQMQTMQKINGSESFDEAFQGVLERHAAEQEWIKAQMAEEKLPQAFVDYFQQDLQYSHANDYSMTPAMFAYFKQVEVDKIGLSGDYFSFYQDIPLNNEAALGHGSYLEYVDAYLNHRLQGTGEMGADQVFQQKFQLAEEVLDSKAETLVKAYLIKGVLDYGNPLVVQEVFPTLKELEGGEDYYSMLEPSFEKAMSLAPGKPAPQFTLLDADGNEVTLDEFSGKILYVDFWASWCGPCRGEMPYSRTLMEQYQDRGDIAFVFISIDDDEAAWRKAMDEEKLGGVHLFSQGFGSEAPQAYNVSAIPNYFIIDRDGTIADPFPPRPSDPNLAPLLDKLLAR